MTAPRLIVDEPKGAVQALALVLHGGRSTSHEAVRSTQLAVLRMRPFVHSLRAADAGLVVAQVRYRVRGWNGAEKSPVADTEWCLEQLTTRFPDVPVALIGHSMGGRTAVYVAGHDAVEVVVALAPWLESGDPVRGLADRRLLIAHGDHDRMTAPGASAAFARAAAPLARSASYVSVQGDGHAMLKRLQLWSELSTGFVLGALLGQAPSGTVGAASAKVLTAALDGAGSLVL